MTGVSLCSMRAYSRRRKPVSEEVRIIGQHAKKHVKNRIIDEGKGCRRPAFAVEYRACENTVRDTGTAEAAEEVPGEAISRRTCEAAVSHRRTE